MAKQKKSKNKADGDLASEEILDSLAEDGEAAQAESANESPAKEPVIPVGKDAHARILRAEFLAWPCEPDHGSAASVLTGEGAGDHEKIVLEDDESGSSGGGLNFALLLLIVGALVGGIWQFVAVSSPEALAAKKAEKEAIEEAHLNEQLAKQKKYGVLRIESNPPQASVRKDGEVMRIKNEAGEEIEVLTPANLMDLDISQNYKFTISKDGHESFEFFVSEHLWQKDSATGEYKFFKNVELTPNVCEYYFLYDAKKKRELKFDDKAGCLEHYEGAMAKGVSVTECTCKIPPEGWEPPKKDDKKKKKGK